MQKTACGELLDVLDPAAHGMGAPQGWARVRKTVPDHCEALEHYPYLPRYPSARMNSTQSLRQNGVCRWVASRSDQDPSLSPTSRYFLETRWDPFHSPLKP